MTTFVIIAAIMLVLALAVLVLPLLRMADASQAIGHEDANLQILRDQLGELGRDLTSGVLTPQQYENERIELERRALEEVERKAAASRRAKSHSRWLAPATLVLVVPLATIVLYAQLGNPGGMDIEAMSQQQSGEITQERVMAMAQQLVQHLEANPDDAEGWGMLGRTYKALHQFDAAAKAWARAVELLPESADALVEYAETLVLAAEGDLSGKPSRLLEKALKLEPEHTKALAMSGGAAFREGDYASAIKHWEKLQALSGDDEELAQALRSGIAEARTRMGSGRPAETGRLVVRDTAISGTISLAPAFAASVSPDDVVFVFARASEGPGMPLAATRISARQLPYAFRLDDSMSVMPGRKLSDARNVIVSARVSKSGDATASSGDLEGKSGVITSVASGVNVIIDQRVP